MQPILVPTINSNDTDALLVSWSKTDGHAVQRGEIIAVLETTKASFELAAEGDGILQISAAPGQRCEFGATLGWLLAEAGERVPAVPENSPAANAEAGDFIVTNAARELVAKHGLTKAALQSLGRKVIKAADLAPLLAPPAEAAGTSAPSAQQLTIARVVARSRATIPDAFLLKKIGADAALGALGEFSREEKILTALPDLLVWIVARLAPEFPFFFGALQENLRFTAATAGNIGVTFDLGTGLFIPVVRGAATLPLKAIAREMMTYRMRALRNRFQAEDLACGDLSISLNTDADILFVQPIILPPQTCMLSLGAVLGEVVLGSDGKPAARAFIQLGVAYDHRVVNGFQANAFLNAIKRQLESPDPAAWR